MQVYHKVSLYSGTSSIKTECMSLLLGRSACTGLHGTYFSDANNIRCDSPYQLQTLSDIAEIGIFYDPAHTNVLPLMGNQPCLGKNPEPGQNELPS
jgi:hypothetical protein